MNRTDAVLVLNVGSSSVKFRVFRAVSALPLLADGRVTGIGSHPLFRLNGQDDRTLNSNLTQPQALKEVLDFAQGDRNGWRLVAAGHRIVHGGTSYCNPVRIDRDILTQLDRLTPLAPLHQPHNLAAIRALANLYPELPQIGCFDTAFHTGHDPVTQSYALPKTLRDQGIRRYGFHGLSYEWTAHVLAQDSGGIPERVVAAHLGNGASLCAMRRGDSIDTTMGMTALEGLPMGTRCGALDPGAVIYMQHSCGLSLREVEHMLYNCSGLKGLSGGLSDMKKLLASNTPEAHLAVDYFTFRTAQKIAEMAVSLGGLDMLVFTGGIGENAAPVRDNILKRLSFLPTFSTRVIEADEERMIARHTLSVLGIA